MKKSILLACLLISVLVGCSENDSSQPATAAENKAGYETLINEKLYFIENDGNKKEFAADYEQLLTEHPELEIVTVESKVTNYGNSSYLKGYYVFTKESNAPERKEE